MTSPRPYVAAVAAAVLAALYFVPSAHASPATATVAATTPATVSAAAAASASARGTATTTQAEPAGSLAETGMIDTKPYVIGGGVFLLAGAGLVVNATRRSRHALQAAEAEEADAEE